MEQVLYDLMDWAGIEELTYSESADPHRLLGSHITEKGLLIQALFPTASAVKVKLSNTGKTYDMELADEAGFFAVLIPRKTKTAYTLLVTTFFIIIFHKSICCLICQRTDRSGFECMTLTKEVRRRSYSS